MRGLEQYTQRLIVSGERERDAAFWQRLPHGSVEEFERFTAASARASGAR